MPRLFSLVLAVSAVVLSIALPVDAGSSAKRRKGKAKRARSGLTPHSLGRAAQRQTISRGRAATLPSVTRDRAASLAPISHGRAATLAPVTTGRAASMPSVTRDRAAAPASISLGRAAGLAPVTTGRAASLRPVTRGRAAAWPSVTAGRAAHLAPVTTGRAASLRPVTRGRAAGLPSIGLDRAAQLPAGSYLRHLETLLADRSGLSVLAYDDGYVAPYGAKDLVREGFFEEVLTEDWREPHAFARVERRVTETFSERGLSGLYRYGGSVYDVLDAVDPYGPHRYYRAPLGRNVPPGAQVGSFYFPAAYYVQPISEGVYGGDTRVALVPRDIVEAIPEDFDRTLRKSNFPLVIGDMAFKEGNYVQAVLAFWEALDRKPDAVTCHFALADALLALRNYGAATELIRAGLEMSPKWADELDRRGVYGVKGDFEKHLDEGALFAESNPRAPEAWFLLGYLQMTSGDAKARKAAEASFRHALMLNPDDGVAQRYLRNLTTPEPVKKK
jgi:tetratricopeptide (TPR) repeat protein